MPQPNPKSPTPEEIAAEEKARRRRQAAAALGLLFIASRLSFDSRTSRYRSRNGRFLGQPAVRTEAERIASVVSRRIVGLSEQLRDGQISLPEWTLRMRDEIKAGHSLNYILARGGRAKMSPSDWGRLGRLTRFHYQALNRFASQIENGGMVHLGRVRMYASAIRNTYENARRSLQLAESQTVPFARWIRTANESCPGCIEQSSRGTQKLSQFPQIGSQQCAANCRCYLEITPNPLGL